MKTLDIEANVVNLYKVIDFIDDELDNAGCSIKTKIQLNIAVEELFVNVSHYAYGSGTGNIRISIDITGDPAMAVISFTDSGIPYDPLSREDPDVGLSAEKRKIGGLGIFMVKKTMDKMEYEFRDGLNIVTISKYI